MKRFRRPDARFHLVAAFAIVLGLSIWVSLALLAQLSSMSELSAAAAQKFSVHGAKNISPEYTDYPSARFWTGLCIAANIALTIILGLWLRAEIARPVQAAAAVLRRIADGDLRSRPAANEVDQGPLLGAMQDMHDKLVTMVARVRAGSEHLSRGAGAIADGSRDLSARSAQQAASLAQAATAMQALGAELERQGEQARQAAGTAHSAADSAARGAAAVADAAGAVAGLDQAARRISGIAGAIDDIAFQSNIVALSAAVEAAQAGEHGAGFGKVAGEVRALALRAAGVARDIQTALGDADVRIAAGHALTRRAANQLGDAAGGLQQAASQIGGMAEAGATQRAGVIQLGRAMAALDAATRQHALLLDDTAASAAQMRDEAGSLSHLAGGYQLGPEYGTPAPRIVLVASNPGKLTTPARAFRRHAGVVPVRLKHGGARPDAAC